MLYVYFLRQVLLLIMDYTSTMIQSAMFYQVM